MNSWKYVNSRNLCEVCEGKRHCRQSPSGLYHCRNGEKADESKFVYRGEDAHGFSMWGLKSEAEAWKSNKSQEYKEEKQRAKEEEKARWKLQLLCDSERDIAIRSLISELPLLPHHHQHLLSRGMSQEQILAGGYSSISPWQKLQNQVNPKLAGVRDGKFLNVGVSGILCPIPNEKGEFVSWQIRLDDATRGDLAKYIWAKGESNGAPISAHLNNGELPLGFYSPNGERNPIVSKWLKNKKVVPVALAEGVAFKPFLAAARLGIHTIGASGGNFASSPQTLKTYLEHIGKIYEGQNIMPILLADAGSLLNPQILKIYENTYIELKKLGYELKIAYWEQVQKKVGDIDEIDEATLSSIKLISYKKFAEIAQKNLYHQKQLKNYLELESLTYKPDIEFDNRYLPDTLSVILPRTGLVALKSPKGTGKSVQIKKLIDNAKKSGKNVISLTPRRALGREQSIKWQITWIGDAEVPGVNLSTVLENAGTLGLCWDSLWKLAERDWSNTIIIIDEVELANSHHLISSTCREKRPAILKVLSNKLQECLSNRGMVLIADADLSNASIDYIKELVPNISIPTFIAVNNYVGKELQYKIDFHTGTKDWLVSKLITDLAIPVTEEEGKRQRRIAIAVDAQKDAEAMERYLFESYPALSTIRIDSTTTETDEGRDFVEHPNEKIAELKPHVLIYTSSMGTGVSIDLSYFDQMYAFFAGVLEPSQCRQMLGRIREPIPRSIWCAVQGYLDNFVSFEPEEIKSRLLTMNTEVSILANVVDSMVDEDANDQQKMAAYNKLLDKKTGTWNNPHINLYAKLVARKNFGLTYLAKELRRQLELEGHEIKEFKNSLETPEGTTVRYIKDCLAIEEAQGIYKAKDISLEAALQMKQKSTTTKQERREISKALLRAELPEISLTPEFIYKSVTKDNRRWLNEQKLFWYVENFEITKILDRKELLHHLEKFKEGTTYIPDIKTYSAKVKLVKDLGIFNYIALHNLDKQYSNTDPEIQDILLKAKKHYQALYYYFNLKVSEKTRGIAFLNYILKRLGIYLKCHHQSSKGIRFYVVDADQLADPDRLAILKALDIKWGHLNPKTSTPSQPNDSITTFNPSPLTENNNLVSNYHPSS